MKMEERDKCSVCWFDRWPEIKPKMKTKIIAKTSVEKERKIFRCDSAEVSMKNEKLVMEKL